jgi:O-antigen/teichoic acid export membrane protein
MNKFYLLGVFGNRALTIVTVLLLTFLLSPSDFGIFSLTATNVLLSNIVLSWWISSAAYKYLTIHNEEILKKYISTMAACTLAAIFISIAFLIALGARYELSLLQVVILCVWAVMLLLFDITLAANNALGRAQSYATFSLIRNFTVLGVTLSLVLAGVGVTGAMIGQALGTLVPFILIPAANRFWRAARVDRVSLSAAKEMFAFGIAGALVLGLYMLTQGFVRNAIEAKLDAAAAGQFALALDLLNAPLMLFGAAFSLSRMRALYQTQALGDPDLILVEARSFIETYVLFAVPYACAGAIVAPDLITLFVGPQMVDGVKSVAQAATVQAGAIQVLGALVTAMLVFDYRRRVIAIIVSLAGTNFLVVWLMPPSSLVHLAWSSTAVIGAFALTGLAICIFGKSKIIGLTKLAKILFATALCASACWSWFHLLPFHEPISAAAVGLIVFLLTAKMLGILDWSNLWERPAS